MATHAEKLAASLRILKKLVGDSKQAIFKSAEFSRVHRERLVKAGFLIEVKKGWLLLTDPAKKAGDSTLWYANYWRFLSLFLEERFEKAYCLSAQSSLILYTGVTTIPKQLTIITEKPSGQPVSLPFDSSLFLYQDAKNLPVDREVREGLQVMTLPEAICRAPKSYFEQHPDEAVVALSLIRDASQLLHYLLMRGQSTTAGYLIGAYRHMGREDMAKRILDTMGAAGHKINVENPLARPVISLSIRSGSPHAARLQALWHRYQPHVVELFPEAPGLPQDIGAYLSAVEEHYLQDAYNSLSIEGYEVSPDLIDRVRSGLWNPSEESTDNAHIERFWRTLKYEGFYVDFPESMSELKTMLAKFIRWYNEERLHSALNYKPPLEVLKMVDFLTRGYVENSKEFPTSPPVQQPQPYCMLN